LSWQETSTGNDGVGDYDWENHALWTTWMHHEGVHQGKWQFCDSWWCRHFTSQKRQEFLEERREEY